ncbi:hypothetical protein [Exiguobacterium oxidotolerans]|uniref:WGR domain-containing protein n=1 Tax=Exiguobacterium oxidotolerans TaxID=223958 RepID=A0A653I675_9BACL|nr:hypothetical protein [Exiguobacterium oxidotolerans]VWX34553.1 conserved hypothetical protein [Exiguobacterium oxidotolerans]
MQLIKPINGQNHFWLFEKDGRTLYTFHGIMGERLEEPMSEQKFSRFFNLDAYIRELVAEKENDGYTVVQEVDYQEVVVEIFCQDKEYDLISEYRSNIEEDLNEFLFSTGNGYFLEDDYGPEAIEFVLHVLEPSQIVELVIEYFKEQFNVNKIRMGQAKVHYGRRLTGLYPTGKNFNRKN